MEWLNKLNEKLDNVIENSTFIKKIQPSLISFYKPVWCFYVSVILFALTIDSFMELVLTINALLALLYHAYEEDKPNKENNENVRKDK